MARSEEAGKGRYWRWNDTRNKETASRLARMYRDAAPKKTKPKPVEAPHVRAGQPCFYADGAGPDVVVDSHVGSDKTVSVQRDFEDFKVRMNCESAEGEKFLRVEYRHANGHMVTRWLWETEAQYQAMRAYVRRIQARKRRERAHFEAGGTVKTKPSRDFERKPILSTQLEPGVTVRCNSYSQFEREVERRNKQIGKIR
jgi:hypothetical protein